MDESALLRQARTGDRSAFGRLIERYAERALHIGMRVLGNREDAEDAVQSAITRACERMETFRGESSFGTWFTSIVVRSCIDFDRRRRARPDFDAIEHATSKPLAAPNRGSLPHMIQRELTSAVEREMQRLPVRIRTALVLRTLDEMPYPDVASTLGITVRTARMYVFEARQRLSKALSELLEDES